MLPNLRKLPSKEMLVSDSHSFYISTSVIQDYKVNQIELVCLLPNSTNKLQLHDIGILPAEGSMAVDSDRIRRATTNYKLAFSRQIFHACWLSFAQTNPAQYSPTAYNRYSRFPVDIDRVP
jgi:hypothetical protein